MGKKKNKSNSQKTNECRSVNENKNEKEEGKQEEENGDGEKNKEPSRITVVLKINNCCDGEILRFVRGFKGVEAVNGDPETHELTVVGKVGPMSLRDKLANNFYHRNVELISPQPKKDSEAEAPKATVVMKKAIHCANCRDRLMRVSATVSGVSSVEIKPAKDLLIVRGAMDVKAVHQRLKNTLTGLCRH